MGKGMYIWTTRAQPIIDVFISTKMNWKNNNASAGARMPQGGLWAARSYINRNTESYKEGMQLYNWNYFKHLKAHKKRFLLNILRMWVGGAYVRLQTDTFYEGILGHIETYLSYSGHISEWIK